MNTGIDGKLVEVVQDWPPNIWDIRGVLPVSRRNIFAFDGRIYSPGSDRLPVWLIEHEKVHHAQQKELGLYEWWRQFLSDPVFRLSQEIPAHQIEWRTWLAAMPRSRNERRVCLKQMAKRLSAPMYGKICTFAEAKKVIAA